MVETWVLLKNGIFLEARREGFVDIFDLLTLLSSVKGDIFLFCQLLWRSWEINSFWCHFTKSSQIFYDQFQMKNHKKSTINNFLEQKITFWSVSSGISHWYKFMMNIKRTNSKSRLPENRNLSYFSQNPSKMSQIIKNILISVYLTIRVTR